MEQPYLLKLRISIVLLPLDAHALSRAPTWFTSNLTGDEDEIVILRATKASVIVGKTSVLATYVLWVATTKTPEETINIYHRHAELDIQGADLTPEEIDSNWFLSEHEATIV
jgi:hypothetical protein